MAAGAAGTPSADSSPALYAHRIHAAPPPFRETTPSRSKIYLDTPAEIDSAQLIQNKGKRSFYLDTEIDDAVIIFSPGNFLVRAAFLSNSLPTCASLTRQWLPRGTHRNSLRTNKSGHAHSTVKLRLPYAKKFAFYRNPGEDREGPIS
jgi:hypothetical protein